MYIPQIKEKHPLVDLARYGTRSRKNIHPDVLIGVHPCHPIYKEGDLLDANAVLDLIKNLYGQGDIYQALEDQINRNKQETDQSIQYLIDKETQLEETVAELEERIEEGSGEGHDPDIQNVKQYIDQEIDKVKVTVVYDMHDENLLIYNVKK